MEVLVVLHEGKPFPLLQGGKCPRHFPQEALAFFPVTGQLLILSLKERNMARENHLFHASYLAAHFLRSIIQWQMTIEVNKHTASFQLYAMEKNHPNKSTHFKIKVPDLLPAFVKVSLNGCCRLRTEHEQPHLWACALSPFILPWERVCHGNGKERSTRGEG